MILEALIAYAYDKRFVYQLISALGTYLALSTIIFVRKRQKRYQIFKYYGIPGPEPSLLNGNFTQAKQDPAIFKTDERWAKQFGKVFGFYVGDEPILVITDAKLLKRIFFDENKSFTERLVPFIETPLSHGILFAKYHRWKFMRKVMSPAFSSYNMRGESSTQFIEESIKLMISYIDDKLKQAEAANEVADIDMHNLMKSTALHLISALAVKLPNVQVKEDDDNVKHLDDFLSSCDKGIVVWAIVFPVLKRMLEILSNNIERSQTMGMIHRGLNRTIDEGLKKLSSKPKRGRNGFESDEQIQLIDLLIKLHYEGKLTREEIIGNAEALLFAGYDTTSTALTYIFWVLGKYTDKQERLRRELMTCGVESKYLLQIINETMRLYPSVAMFTSRLATQTVEIDGWVIPQGSRVIHNTWIMHQHPDLWVDPQKFDESRFHEGADIDPVGFAPFGLGDRKCLGYQLALLEIKMVVCDILLRYRLKLKSPDKLHIISCAISLTKPKDKVIIELERL